MAGITECACCIGSPKIVVVPGPDSCSACVDDSGDDGCAASWPLYVAIAVCLMAVAIAFKYRKTLASKCSKQERGDDSLQEQMITP